MLSWITSIHFTELFIGMVIGGVFSVWLQQFLQIPKLKISGSGGGGSSMPGGHNSNQATILNPPALIGLPLRETVLFGYRLFSNFDFGVRFNRNAARKCNAILWDVDADQMVGTLQWRVGGQIKDVVDIEPGDTAELMMFARLTDDPTRYFAFQAQSDGTLIVPPLEARASETRRFRIEIRHSYDRKMKFKAEVIKGFDGRFRVRFNRGSCLL